MSFTAIFVSSLMDGHSLALGEEQIHRVLRAPQSRSGIKPFQSRLGSHILGFYAWTRSALQLLTWGAQLAHV